MPNSRPAKHIGILGAGPSGLSMARFLKAECDILERGTAVGGHAGSFSREGYTFDYGPHILFSKNKAVLDYLVRSLGSNVMQCRRNNKISFKGRLIRYPFENDLGALDPEDNFRCTWDFLNNSYTEQFRHPKNLEEWLLANFGKGICEAYLFPYNRKVWNIPVDRLSMSWAERIPKPSKETILKAALGFKTEGYLHQLYYHYPQRGGYQALSQALAAGVKPVRFGYEVRSVRRLKGSRWEVSDGKAPLVFDELVSTIPIHELLKVAQFDVPESVRRAVQDLIVNPMYVVSLGIRGKDREKMTAIYFPEKEFLPNRLSYPATFSSENAPPGHHSIQAEITCRAGSKVWQMSDQDVLEHVIAGLVQRRLLTRKAITLTDVKRSLYAYVVYDTAYQKNAELVRNWFRRQRIHLVGRFSYFEYVNVDGAVERAMEIAGKINGQPVTLR